MFKIKWSMSLTGHRLCMILNLMKEKGKICDTETSKEKGISNAWSVDHFDGVCVARAAVHPGWAPAGAGVAALLRGAMKLRNGSLAHGRLRECRNEEEEEEKRDSECFSFLSKRVTQELEAASAPAARRSGVRQWQNCWVESRPSPAGCAANSCRRRCGRWREPLWSLRVSGEGPWRQHVRRPGK